MVSRGGVCLSVSKFGTFPAQKLIPSCAFLGRTCGKKIILKYLLSDYQQKYQYHSSAEPETAAGVRKCLRKHLRKQEKVNLEMQLAKLRLTFPQTLF